MVNLFCKKFPYLVFRGMKLSPIVPEDISQAWKKWLVLLSLLEDFSISRNCLADCRPTLGKASYQLHGFGDASNSAYSCVVYLRCWEAGSLFFKPARLWKNSIVVYTFGLTPKLW